MDTSMLPDIATKLFPNFWTWIIQICSTLVLLFFFKKYLWKPVLAYFEKRADYIEKNIKDSADMREQATQYLAEADKQARNSALEYQEIVNRAKEDANKKKQEILNEANEQARHKIALAEAEIASERAQAQEDMREEIIEIATEVASKIMDKEMNSTAHNDMVKDFVDEVMN